MQLLVILAVILLAGMGYLAFRGFAAELSNYTPSIGPIGFRFYGTIPEVHAQLVGAIERVGGASVYSDEGHTVMVTTFPSVRIEGAFGLFARAELRQLNGSQTEIIWTAMPKTSWATSDDLKLRSLVQIERDIRNRMKSSFSAREVI